MTKNQKHANGYSLIELLVATILFTIIAGTAFSLLFSAQLRYRNESGATAAFQQANVAIDQITRDVHSAGYPPANAFAAGVVANSPQLMAMPFAWSPGYTNVPPTPCTVKGNCVVPGDYDLIVETDPGDGTVRWIRYSLQGTTLMRGVLTKQAFADPVASTSSPDVLVPYLENVMNGSRPIFTYGPNPVSQPSDIREVNIFLIVQSAQPDPDTQLFRTVTLSGQAVRFNPNN